MRLVAAMAVLLAFTFSCASDSGDPAGPPVGPDVVVPGEDTAAGDTSPAPPEPDECLWEGVPQPEVSVENKKFALSMFHFNIQYVCGGLHRPGAEDGLELACGEPCRGWTDEKLNDWFIEVAFEPTLDLYLRYPHWQVTFEMQGLMLEWMAERYPEVLQKLREGAQRGQIEVVSLHYSDQLFLAYPRYDLAQSQEITRRLFEDHCVPLSPVLFNQEGQSGIGKHDFAAPRGYEIDVFPVNLYRYYRYDEPIALWYKSGEMDVVVGPGEGYHSLDPPVFQHDEATGLEVTWAFFDDGELVSFPPSPYFAPFSTPSQVAADVANYEQRLLALEEAGFKLSSISNYVRHLEAHGAEQPDLPPVLDGTWQPPSTDSIHRWMGGRGMIPGWARMERDNEMLTANYQRRTVLQAADVLVAVAKAEGHDVAELEAELHQGHHHMALAQVTDATGITPWPGEFEYSIMHYTYALEIAEAALDAAKELLGWPHAEIDLAAFEARRIEALPEHDPPPEAEEPFAVEALTPTRDHEITWFKHDESLYEVQLHFGPGDSPDGSDEEKCRVTMRFPRFEDRITYSPALIEDRVMDYAIDEFSFQEEAAWLPLANGLIGLGDGWWALKDCRSVHVAARIPKDEPHIEFIDSTAAPEGGITWRFFVFNGTVEEAVALSIEKNIAPTVHW